MENRKELLGTYWGKYTSLALISRWDIVHHFSYPWPYRDSVSRVQVNSQPAIDIVSKWISRTNLHRRSKVIRGSASVNLTNRFTWKELHSQSENLTFCTKCVTNFLPLWLGGSHNLAEGIKVICTEELLLELETHANYLGNLLKCGFCLEGNEVRISNKVSLNSDKAGL